MNAKTDLAVRLGGGDYILRPVGHADAQAVGGLFTEVFGQTPPEGWYSWKYGPHGLKGFAMGLWDGEARLIAHYAAFPRTLIWRGRRVAAVQIGDVMVAPRARGLLTRRGPFFHVCSALFERWVGSHRPYALAYGFPNERHLRLGVRLALYHDLGAIVRLAWSAEETIASASGWVIEDLEQGLPGALVERAWRWMRGDFGNEVVGERDAGYLAARFEHRPGIQHRYLVVRRRWSRQSAVAVWRVEEGSLRWLDYVGPRALLPVVANSLRQRAHALGLSAVETWASPRARAELLITGAVETGPVARFALAQTSDGMDGSLAQAGWWLAGDTDFL